jgi:pimeloyl-ACP methyl ester carboxylesterase
MNGIDAATLLESQILSIFMQLLENSELTGDDDFFESGGDSLLATDLLHEIERVTGVSLPETLLFEASTSKALAERLGEVDQPQLRVATPILQRSQSDRPMMFFHGDWTAGGFYLKALASQVRGRFPLVAIAPHGVQGTTIPSTIERMAEERVDAIQELQSEGPYRLGGHCVGGMVALETARLLQRRGHEVELLVMVDPLWLENGEPRMILRKVPTSNGKPVLPNMEATPDSVQRYAGALRRYSPPALTVPTLLFSSIHDPKPWIPVLPQLKILDRVSGHYDWITLYSEEFLDAICERLGIFANKVLAPDARTGS